MKHEANRGSKLVVVMLWTVIGLLSAAQCAAQVAHNNEFVKRDGTRLTLGGQTYRYSGPNVEWLGLEAYGPDDALGPRYPSHAEVDDVLDTAKMMGARVVRSQTLGDSVGCKLCIEPRPGVFNPNAFAAIDYAIKAAHERGLRLIITLVGDCSYCRGGGVGKYVSWAGQKDPKKFFTDPKIIAAVERHISAVLNHRNRLTGVLYKNDPTIMAWENCNLCGLVALGSAFKKNPGPYLRWIDTIGSYIKSIDKQHLYEDNSGFFLMDKKALDAKTSDIVTSEYYPHWDWLFGPQHKTTARSFVKDAATVTSKGKVYVVNEFGWDKTNWPTRQSFQAVLKTLASDRAISGDGYWALQAHAPKFGWQPISAPANRAAYAAWGETGQWWSLYWGGVTTKVHSAGEMQTRAEMLRAHAFAMAGRPVPPYPIPAAPVITFRGLGILAWRGSPGAVVYSVQRRKSGSSHWKTICDRCATDADTPWVDKQAKHSSLAALLSDQYRVIAYNADGKASAPSAAR